MFTQELIDQLDDEMGSSVDWEEALCRDVSAATSELFFSDRISDIVRAKAICAGCSLIELCLEGAIRRREPCGVWGGQLFANGKILAQKRQRGRPRKDRPAAFRPTDKTRPEAQGLSSPA